MARHSNSRSLPNYPSPSETKAGRVVASTLAILEGSAIASTVTSDVNTTNVGGGEFARETTAMDTTFGVDWNAIRNSIRHGFGPLATTVRLSGYRDRVVLRYCDHFLSSAPKGGEKAMVHRSSNSVRRHWLAQLHARHERSSIREKNKLSDEARLTPNDWHVGSRGSPIIDTRGFKSFPMDTKKILSKRVRQYIMSVSRNKDHLPQEKDDREWWLETNHELIQDWWESYVKKVRKTPNLPSALIFRSYDDPGPPPGTLHFCWKEDSYRKGFPILTYILRALRARDRFKSLPLTIRFGSPRALLGSGIREKDYTTLEQIPDDLSVLDPEELWIKVSEDPDLTLDREETDEEMLLRTPIICRSRDFDKAFHACMSLK